MWKKRIKTRFSFLAQMMDQNQLTKVDTLIKASASDEEVEAAFQKATAIFPVSVSS
jgi:hypothetical protein